MRKYDMSKLSSIDPGTLRVTAASGYYKSGTSGKIYFSPTALAIETEVFDTKNMPDSDRRERFRGFVLDQWEQGNMKVHLYEGELLVEMDFMEQDETAKRDKSDDKPSQRIPNRIKYAIQRDFGRYETSLKESEVSDPMEQTSGELVVGRGIAGDPDESVEPSQPGAPEADAATDPVRKPTKNYRDHLRELGDASPVNPDDVIEEKPVSSTTQEMSAYLTWMDEFQRLMPGISDGIREQVSTAIAKIGEYGDAGRKQKEMYALLLEARKMSNGRENRLGELLGNYTANESAELMSAFERPRKVHIPEGGPAPSLANIDKELDDILNGSGEDSGEGQPPAEASETAGAFIRGLLEDPANQAAAPEEDDDDSPIPGKLFDLSDRTVLSYIDSDCTGGEDGEIDTFRYMTREGSTEPMVIAGDAAEALTNKYLMGLVHEVSDRDEKGNQSVMIPKRVFDRLLEIDEKIGKCTAAKEGKIYLSDLSENWGRDMQTTVVIIQEKGIEVIGGDRPYIKESEFQRLAEVDTFYRMEVAGIETSDEAFKPIEIAFNYFPGMSPEDREKRIHDRRTYVHNKIKEAVGQLAEPGEDINPDIRFEYRVNRMREGKTFPSVIRDRETGIVYKIHRQCDIIDAVERSMRPERFTVRMLEAMLEEAKKKGADTATIRSTLVECLGAKPEDLEGRDLSEVIKGYMSDRGAVQALTRNREKSRIFGENTRILRRRPDAEAAPAPADVPADNVVSDLAKELDEAEGAPAGPGASPAGDGKYDILRDMFACEPGDGGAEAQEDGHVGTDGGVEIQDEEMIFDDPNPEDIIGSFGGEVLVGEGGLPGGPLEADYDDRTEETYIETEDVPEASFADYSDLIHPEFGLDVVGFANRMDYKLEWLKEKLRAAGLTITEFDDGNVVYCDISSPGASHLREFFMPGQLPDDQEPEVPGSTAGEPETDNAMAPEQAYRNGARAISGIFNALAEGGLERGAKEVLRKRAGERNYDPLTDEEKREAGAYSGQLDEALEGLSSIAHALGPEAHSIISDQSRIKLSDRKTRKRQARKGMPGFVERVASDPKYRSQIDQDIDLGNSVRNYIALDSILEELGYESLRDMIGAGKAEIISEDEVYGRDYNSDGYIKIEGSTFRFRRLKASGKIMLFSDDVLRAAGEADIEIRYAQAEAEAPAEDGVPVTILAQALADVGEAAPEGPGEPETTEPAPAPAEEPEAAAPVPSPAPVEPPAAPPETPAQPEAPETVHEPAPAQLGGDAPLGEAVLGGGEPGQPYEAPSITPVEPPAEPAPEHEAAPVPAPAAVAPAEPPEAPVLPDPAPVPESDPETVDEPPAAPAPPVEPGTVAPADPQAPAEPLVIEPGYADRVLPLTDEEKAVYEALKRDYVRGFKDLFKNL